MIFVIPGYFAPPRRFFGGTVLRTVSLHSTISPYTTTPGSESRATTLGRSPSPLSLPSSLSGLTP